MSSCLGRDLSRGHLLAMAGLWALQWSLLVLVVADTEDAPQQKPPVRYLPHGIQLLTAPYPARRNIDFVHGYRPKRPGHSSTYLPRAGNVQLFGDPLPGDNFSFTHVPNGPRMHPQQARAGGFGPYQKPNLHDLPLLDEPLVTRQVLGPPPPSIDLSHLAQISGSRVGPFRSGQPAHGLPPPGPIDLSRHSQVGQGFGPPQMLESYASMNPWYGLPIPTAMGPYQRRLKLKQMPPPVELRPSPPQSPLRDIDDPKKKATKVSMPYDSWLGAQEGGLMPPPVPEQLAPLAPPRMRASNASLLRQGGNADDQDYSLASMLRNIPRFHEFLEDEGHEESSTRWRYRYVGGSLEPAPSPKPPPALLSKEGGMMDEPSPESNADASQFSDAAKPVKPRPPSNIKTFDYILL